jgi:hypothetical protein
LILLIPPFRKKLKNATIQPLNLSQEKLDELKAIMEKPNMADIRKSTIMRQVTGACHSSGQMATQIATYRKYGAIVIEKYCDQCLARINT